MYAQPNFVGHQFMVVASVLVGRTCVGSHKLTSLDSDVADIAVNESKPWSVACMFDASQAMPEFIIEFSEMA